jgi:hypothetical protein
MAIEILTHEDLKQFRLQLLEDLKVLFPQSHQAPKQWLKSSDVRKMLGISHGTLQNLRINRKIPFTRLGGIMFYRLDDIVKLLEEANTSKHP